MRRLLCFAASLTWFAAVAGNAQELPTLSGGNEFPIACYDKEMQLLGVCTPTELVEKMPSVAGSYVNDKISNGGDGRTELNLRGLGVRENLVLVDGRRVAPSLFGSSLGAHSVDLNFIPFPLVDHIDLLKNVASSRFGSDSISGVFNVYLKHRFRGFEMDASYGNTNLGASNDAAERQAYVIAGTGDENTDIVVFAEDYDRAAIFSRDRDLSSNANYHRFGGIDLRSGNFAGRVQGFVFVPGVGRGPAGPNSPTPHAYPNPARDPEYQPRTRVDRNSDRFAYNFAALTSAIPAADRQYYYGSLVRDLCEKYLALFADFKIARTFWTAFEAPTPLALDPFTKGFGLPFAPAGISVPLQNPYNPFTTANATLPASAGPYAGSPVTTGVFYRTLEAGPRDAKQTHYEQLFNAGLRGRVAKSGSYFDSWAWETSFRYDSVGRNFFFGNAASKPALREALFDTNPSTAFNAFGLNVQTPAAKQRVFVDLQNTSSTTLMLEDALLYGDVFRLPAGPISFDLVGSHRTERYRDIPDSLSVTFNTIGSTDQQASRGERDVWSASGDLLIPFASPSWNLPGIHSLSLLASYAGEYFSDFGWIWKPGFSMRYQPVSWATFRGSYVETYHVPYLNELSPAAGETFPIVPISPGGPGFQLRVLSSGNPALRPEQAYEWTYGIVLSPPFLRDFTVAVSFYHFDVRDYAISVSNEFILEHPTLFQNAVVFAGFTPVQINNRTVNFGRIINESIDFEAIYQVDTQRVFGADFGKFTWTTNATYLSRFDFANVPHGKEVDETGTYAAFGALPHWRGYSSLFDELGNWTTGATVHYTGQYGDTPGFASNFGTRKVREWTTLDLLASYTFRLGSPEPQPVGFNKDKQVTRVSTANEASCGWRAWLNDTSIAIGVNNLFDQDPPFVAGAFENGYDEVTADIKGRFCYVSLKKRF